MIPMSAKHLRLLGHGLPRLLWALLTAIHTPILAAVLAETLSEGFTAGRLGSGLALALVTTFFALKACDVWFLRLRSRRHGFMAFCVITALVHHDLVPQSVDEAAMVRTTVVLTAAMAFGEVLRREKTLLRQWGDFLRGILVGGGVKPVAVAMAWADTAPKQHGTVRTTAVPRAPPA